MMLDKWNEIKIEKFYRINKFLGSKQYKTLTELDRSINLVGIISDLDFEQVEEYTIGKLLKEINKLKFLSEELPKVKIKKTIKIENVEFLINYDIPSLKTFEFLDLDTYLNMEENIHLVLSIILKPIEKVEKTKWNTKKYIIEENYDRNEIAEFLKYNLDIATANSILAFFLKVLKKLITYSVNQMKMQQIRIMMKMMFKKVKNRETLLIGLDGLTELERKLEEVGQKFII